MATKRKTQIEKIENVLRKYTAGPGVSPEGISKLARVPLLNVYKRIHDLREYHIIHTNYRNVNGKRKTFYRMES